MNIIEALKTGRPIRRKCVHEFWTNVENADLMQLSVEAILADDWEVKPEIVEISKEDYFKSLAEWAKEEYLRRPSWMNQTQYVDYMTQGAALIWEQLKKNGKIK